MLLALLFSCRTEDWCARLKLDCAEVEALPDVMWIDEDADGWVLGEDCDDQDPLVSPGQSEICNHEDDNCDGAVDEGLEMSSPWYQDQDQDGFGAGEGSTDCVDVLSWSSTAGDCDDAERDIWPGAPEYCDGIDQDCDGRVDNDPVDGGLEYHPDEDADGYINAGALVGGSTWCVWPGEGLLPEEALGEDCQDLDPKISPIGVEMCNGEDDDCDGFFDEEPVDGVVAFSDADLDGYSADDGVTYSFPTCTFAPTYTTSLGDCALGDGSIHPGRAERCDGVDQDCDGEVDEGFVVWQDLDMDGWGDPAATQPGCPTEGWSARPGDCDDSDPAVHPGAPEGCEEEDRNCDGSAGLVDLDGDGWEACKDCDDADASRHPGAPERCDDLDFDDDCDGLAEDADAPELSTTAAWWPDLDGDGHGDASAEPLQACDWPGEGWVSGAEDCDDEDEEVGPGRSERCGTQADDNCDGDPGECHYFTDSLSNSILVSAGGSELAPNAPLCASEDGEVIWTESQYSLEVLALPAAGFALDQPSARFPAALSGVELGDLTLMDDAVRLIRCQRDLTGDGVADLLVASMSDAGTPGSYGEVALIAGPIPAGRSDLEDIRWEQWSLDTLGHDFGWSMDAVELSPDAGPRVATWAPQQGGTGEPILYLLDPSRPASPTLLEQDQLLGGPTSADPLLMHASPDLDGDGLDELLLVQAPIDAPSELWLIQEPPAGMTSLEDVALRLVGDAPGDGAGLSMDSPGDLDGDGLGELVLGVPEDDTVREDAGVVLVLRAADLYSGLGLRESSSAQIYAGANNIGFGTALKHGDLDGDGETEELVVVNGLSTDVSVATAFVLDLPSSGQHLAADLGEMEWLTGNFSEGTETMLFTDLDGNGYDDLLLSRSGYSGTMLVWPQPAW
jgi:Putative metal-binding motif